VKGDNSRGKQKIEEGREGSREEMRKGEEKRREERRGEHKRKERGSGKSRQHCIFASAG
jgi:hypothetical protein